ncbi:MAG: C40 family peptidase, partial [Primorskyibacter sp.]
DARADRGRNRAHGPVLARSVSGIVPVTGASAHWSARYLGIPFEDLGRSDAGCDCWGLAWLIYHRELGWDLPRFDRAYPCATELHSVAQVFDRAEQTTNWIAVSPPRAFDLCVFRTGRYRSHVGIALDARRMIHVAARDCAKIEPLTAPRWSSRLTGAYRHSDMMRDLHDHGSKSRA